MMRRFIVFSVILCQHLGDCWNPQLLHVLATPSRGKTNRPSQITRAAHRPSISEETDRKGGFFFPWSDDTREMKNQVEYMKKPHEKPKQNRSPELFGGGSVAGIVTVAVAVTMARYLDISSSDIVDRVQEVVQNPSAALDQVVQSVESMGSLGVVYFGVAYTLAEILAIPAIPLTASAGYLFGPVEGTTVVLISASVAAAVSFIIGRTLLRDWVENILEDYPKFAKIDRAIGKEGFRLMLLLRLSPVFPFALSNYLYGASSIDFSSFFFGTLFGFAPGTLAYVYTGYVGKTLSGGAESSYPWFVYAGGLVVLAGLLNVAADTASQVVDSLEEDDDTGVPWSYPSQLTIICGHTVTSCFVALRKGSNTTERSNHFRLWFESMAIDEDQKKLLRPNFASKQALSG
eukprot:scaffold345_cov134-Cylindrotheca_fusiformis.AAC.62